MAADPPEPPQYNRYRAGRRLRPHNEPDLGRPRLSPGLAPSGAAAERRPASRWSVEGWRSPRRILTVLLALVLAWLALSLVLFLISSHFRRSPLQTDVTAALDPAGNPLTSANTILVLGSDRRQKNSKEPGAETTGFGRSDTIMLVRTGGGHAARLSIPRDTVIEIPGHGLQKINAAHAFGGPRESVEVIKHWLGIPINHVIEVNFENFPQLIDSMGGVDYTGGCVISYLDGGFRRGGYTLKLKAGTHHLDGRAALALARTRKNQCAPSQTDIQRQEHQQALLNSIKSRLLSPSSFLRLPLIAWNTPPAVISDMSGETLLGLFAGLAIGGTPRTHVLLGQPTVTSAGDGFSVSQSQIHSAVAQFLAG